MIEFIRGICTPVSTTSIPASVRMASNRADEVFGTRNASVWPCPSGCQGLDSAGPGAVFAEDRLPLDAAVVVDGVGAVEGDLVVAPVGRAERTGARDGDGGDACRAGGRRNHGEDARAVRGPERQVALGANAADAGEQW